MVILLMIKPRLLFSPRGPILFGQCTGLFKMVRPNDNLFFTTAVTVDKTEDLDGDEEDGYDETIYPADFKRAGTMLMMKCMKLWSVCCLWMSFNCNF